MINLLSLAEKKALAHEYHRRQVVVVGALLLGVVAVALAISVSFYILLLSKSKSLEESLATASVGEETKRFDELKLILDEASREVKILVEPGETKRFSAILEQVVTTRTAGVRLGQITVRRTEAGKGAMVLGGSAGTRDQFLGFIQALEASPGIEKVSYPVSTLIKERSINFSLAIELNYAGS